MLKAFGLFVLLSSLTFLLNISLSFGLFDATITSIETIYKDDTSLIDVSGLRIRKVNRTQHVMSGKFAFNVDVGQEYICVTYAYKKSGNGYTKLPYKFGPMPFCKYADEEQFFFENIRNVSDFPPIGTCPWPKKQYTINGYYMNIEKIPTVFSSGQYKLESNIMLKGKLVNGLNVVLNLEHI